jgi:hydrogenase expression/formation protein HypC
MCLAIPAKITKIDGAIAQVDIGGNTKDVNITLTPEAKIGDYLLVHAGYAIEILDQESADQIFDAWEVAVNALEK